MELSIDENNAAAAIRDAVIGAEPDGCHGCDYALEHSYEIGQYARDNNMDPESAALLAWGYMGACCRTEIAVELLTPVSSPSTSDQSILIPA